MEVSAHAGGSLFSPETIEVDKQFHVFSQSAGRTEFAPTHETLLDVIALSFKRFASGDEHQGDENLETIEAETHAIGNFRDVTTHGR